MSAAERRSAIVDAAVTLFAERGFRGATTRELAAACGVSEPVLYDHFSTKAALYEAILEASSAETDVKFWERIEQLSIEGNNSALFHELAAFLLDWHVRDPRFARLLLFSALERHELSSLFFERRVACFNEFLTRHIQRQIDLGVFRPVDPLIAARAFAGMVAQQGLNFSVLMPGSLPGEPTEIVGAIAGLFLKGISA
jgi:AcrR family transcriptional regulator